MIETPQGIIDTPLGPVRFTMTEATHVHLHTLPDDNIVIHGIPYHVSYHCHLVGNKWTAKDWHEPYLSRQDCFKDPSQAARNTAREKLALAWADYRAQHPELSRQAEQSKMAEEIEHLESELTDLAQKIADKRTELADAKKRLAAL